MIVDKRSEVGRWFGSIAAQDLSAVLEMEPNEVNEQR